MEERKTMGSALVDVFDAGVVLVKSEINAVGKKVGDVAKAKGVGVALMLAAAGPIILGLIFLILAVFYLLSLWLPAWGAALVIALLSFALAGALIAFAMQKLSAHVDTEMPRHPVPLSKAESSVPATPAAPVGAAIAAGTAATAAEKHPEAVYVKDMRFPSDDVIGHSASSVERANHTVYESKPSGEAQYYGSGLNKKLNDGHADPELHNPVTLKDTPGISVSTKPTYPEDMRKEGY
ncbi:phage holin family protein [Deinococcus fonticola]|uniref:phage holin family protein n=1 Tax=Deinococcus fonticola TaxID=2528713 RepID=UPI001074B97C|nr:phage holin family protein [Deinococcus fonticola]